MKSAVPLALGLAAALSLALAGYVSGLAGVFLVAAGLTLAAVIALIWASLDQLAGSGELTFHDAYHLAAPTAAEEQKRAVLRALKDLEYELAVGKISQEDYAELSTHYREEARRFIALADESLAEGRRRAEEALQRELERRDGEQRATSVPAEQVESPRGEEP